MIDRPADAQPLRLRPPTRSWEARLARLAAGWRDLLLQGVVFVAIAGLLAWMVQNARYAMEKRGIASGFSFLFDEGGFAIGEAFFSFSAGQTYLQAFLAGVGNTAVLAVAGIVTASLLGTLVALARLSSNRLLSGFGAVYVEFFRNSPPLLQILFLYTVFPLLPGPRQAWSLFEAVFVSNRGIIAPAPDRPWLFGGLLLALLLGTAGAILLYRLIDARRRRGIPQPRRIGLLYGAMILAPALVLAAFQADGLGWTAPRLQGFNFTGGMTLSPEFMALYFGLSLYAAAFIAEVVRAGILSIDRGQIEAANAIALSPWDRFVKIEVPQALRVIVPPLASQYISLVKNSSLGVAIGYPELFSITNTVLTYSGHTIEVIAIMALIYLLISLAIGAAAAVVNRAVQIRER